MSRQVTSLRRKRREVAKAEAFIENAVLALLSRQEHNEAMTKETIAVVIVGPNLPAKAKATFHVHAKGCADLEKGWIKSYVDQDGVGPYVLEVSSPLDVEADVYYFAPEESENYTLGDYQSDFHFAPCVKFPEEENVTETTTEEKQKRKRQRKPAEYDFTSDDIVRARDHKGQSWKQVAVELGLGGPSAARKAYTELTGVPHNQSQPLVKRQPKGTFSGKPVDRPVWDDDSDQEAIEDRLQGEWIPARGQGKDYVPGHYQGSLVTIERNTFGFPFTEEIQVSRVEKFRFTPDDKLEIHVFDKASNGSRVFLASDVKKVQ